MRCQAVCGENASQTREKHRKVLFFAVLYQANPAALRSTVMGFPGIRNR